MRTVLIGIAPDEMTVMGLGTPFAEPHRIPLDTRGPETLPRAAGLLAAYVAGMTPEPTQLQIVVSNHFVRYVVLRPETPIHSIEGFRNLAAIKLEEQFGSLAREWTIAVNPTPGRATTLASGMPTAWIETLTTKLPSFAKILTIRPLWMPFFNEVCKSIGDQSGHLMVLESDRVTVARVGGGEWEWMTSRAARAGDPDAIAHLLQEEGGSSLNHEALPLWYADVSGHQAILESLGHPIKRIHPPGASAVTVLAAWGKV